MQSVLIAAIAYPKVKDARQYKAEVAVIGEVRAIQQAQTQYRSQYGRYANNLVELGPPDHGDAGPQAASLIPWSLASGARYDYLFSTKPTATGYAVTAIPKVFGGSGRRTFYLDQDGIVHQNWGREPATERSPEAK